MPEDEHAPARLEHVIEELRVQTKECIRRTAEARLAAEAGKEQRRRRDSASPG